MAIKRVVDTSFWTDDKVMDMFSAEDRYFMLYIMTNPHTTQLGIYRINIKYMSLELGYSQDVVRVLLERFENKYDITKYSYDTQELAIKNYLKHSIVKGGAPVRDCLIKELKSVKNKDLIVWVFSNLKGSDNLNETVKNIISEYEEKNGTLYYSNDKQNDNANENDNENDVSYHDSCNDSYNDSLNTDTPSHKSPNQLLEDEFEKLWKLYPKKVGKPKALQKYKKFRTSKGNDYCTYGDVLAGLEKYLKYIEQNSWYSPKDGATWFNNQGWHDEYDLKEEVHNEPYESDFTLHNVMDDEPVTEDILSDDEIESLLKGFRGGF